MSAGAWEAIERAEGGTLYLVATPIGNARDITLRALDVLATSDLVACEDTRRTRTLLARYGVRPRLATCHEHNERRAAERLARELAAGRSVALVSNAGTPLLSDPGFPVVRAALEAGARVVSLPGPCAAVAALVASGLAVHRFLFLGFAPKKPGARRRLLEGAREEAGTLLLYESARRLAALLVEAHDALGDRRACVLREMTKLHEEARRGTLSELAAWAASAGEIPGEVTVAIAGLAR